MEKEHQKTLEQLEQQHKNEIISTFFNYQELMKNTSPGADLYRQRKRIKNIKYYELLQQRKRKSFEKAVQANQTFLKQILQFCEGQKIGQTIKQDFPVSYSNFSKIKTTIKQFYRQWCEESPQIKDYIKIVEKAKKYLKKNDKILAPGSGLGRLVLELVEAGFGCQGNQVSYFMLFGSNFVLNCCEQPNQYIIYPFISSADYYNSEEDIFRAVKIPDKAACQVVDESADFSMAGGEFTDIYGKQENEFEGVATCFFIDTANNVFDYINIIHKILKKDGIWINYGPLLFHYRQIFSQVSIEVSWQVLKKFISQKFEILQEEMNETSYCHDPKSEMGMEYNCIMLICRKIAE